MHPIFYTQQFGSDIGAPHTIRLGMSAWLPWQNGAILYVMCVWCFGVAKEEWIVVYKDECHSLFIGV